jgi:hypothetical protein
MAQEIALAGWLEELAVFGTPRRFHNSETAHHLSKAIYHWYIVKLALETRPHSPRAAGLRRNRTEALKRR